MAADPIDAHYGMVWVDGIDRYVTRAAAFTFQAMGHKVHWETEQVDPDLNKPLQFKDD